MNISIIGSKHTIDIFERNKNKKVDEEYVIASYTPMISMLSLMSDPILYNYRRLSMLEIDESSFERLFFDLEKNTIRTIESIQPDVLVMDFYADARFGALSYENEYVTNEITDLIGKGIIVGKNLGITYSYKNNTEDYIMVWKNYFDRFMAYMTENLPNIKIIINAAKLPESYADMVSNEIDVKRINMLWNAFDKYAIKKYNLKYLAKDEEFLLDKKLKNVMSKKFDLIFDKEYYSKAFKDFRLVTKNINISENKDSHKNLILDSAFSRGFDCWSNMIGKYELVKCKKYYALKVLDCREQLGEYNPQIWTKAISIEGNGEVEYTLSFYINIPDIDKFNENSIVFRIRTFDNVKGIKADETVDWYRLTLEGHEIESGTDYRYVFKFKPKGKYLRLAPFLVECEEGVTYSKIKLERTSQVSEYSK